MGRRGRTAHQKKEREGGTRAEKKESGRRDEYSIVLK